MKLRIKGDSLRLRVSRSELAQLLNGERIEDTIHFGTAPDAHLTYALESAAQSSPVKLSYHSNRVTVTLSPEQLNSWGSESEVGIYTSVDIGEAGSLELVIEKDFACLDRSHEDNADTFENPHAGSIC